MAKLERGESKAVETRALQLDEDMPFQRKTWAAERIGWLVIAALIILALLGLFSSGLLSSATAEDESGIIHVEYNRFERMQASSNLRITVTLPSNADEIFRLRISKEFADNFEITQIQPRPEEAIGEGEGLLLAFRIDSSGSSSNIYLSVTPQRTGIINSEISAVGQVPVRFTQFVFP